jgi:hypothetical protein
MNKPEPKISKNKSRITLGANSFCSVTCSFLTDYDIVIDEKILVSGSQKNSPETSPEAWTGTSLPDFKANSIRILPNGTRYVHKLWHKQLATAGPTNAKKPKTTKKTQIPTSVHPILRSSSCRPAAGKPSQIANQEAGAIIARKTSTPVVPLMDALKPRRWLDHQFLSIPINAGKFEKLPSSNSFRHA